MANLYSKTHLSHLRAQLIKRGFVDPSQFAMDPAAMDPAMMGGGMPPGAGGGMPPMDPMAAQGAVGGMPMDPAMMGQAAMDPAMMGGAPPAAPAPAPAPAAPAGVSKEEVMALIQQALSGGTAAQATGGGQGGGSGGSSSGSKGKKGAGNEQLGQMAIDLAQIKAVQAQILDQLALITGEPVNTMAITSAAGSPAPEGAEEAPAPEGAPAGGEAGAAPPMIPGAFQGVEPIQPAFNMPAPQQPAMA